MAYDGQGVLTDIKGHVAIDLDFPDLDADAEETHALFPVDNDLRFMPTDAVLYVTAAHATVVTDVVDIALQGSAFGTQWTDLATVTDADVDNNSTTTGDSAEVSATRFAPGKFRFFRILCTTVGVGNTLRAFVRLVRNP